MKKSRIIALLCVLMLVLTSVSFASAETPQFGLHVRSNVLDRRIGNIESFYLLKNGKTVKFFTHADYLTLYPGFKNESHQYSYSDIIFDCASAVKASCSASWVHITNYKNGFFMSCDSNQTQKNRTATITFKGTGYKATLKLTQYGKNAFTKVTRKGKTITFKYKFAKAADGGYLSVYAYKYNNDENNSETTYSKSIELAPGSSSVKFKMTKGWHYSFSLCGYYHPYETVNTSNSTDWISYDATESSSLVGTTTLR